MEVITPTVALYDFLYKDHERIASYYAQIFSGKITLIEQTSVERRATEQTYKASVTVAGYDKKETEDVQETIKQVVDPHDRATNDLLSYLSQNGFLSTNIETAAPGSLVLLKGSLHFCDKRLLEIGVRRILIDAMQERKKPRQVLNKGEFTEIESMVSNTVAETLSSTFYLDTENGFIGGTLKEESLPEKVGSFNLRSGGGGIPDAYLIGIKDAATPPLTSPPHIPAMAQSSASFLRGMLFPETFHAVTPIALFRKLL